MKHLRTHRPLREIVISYFHQLTPTPWGPRQAQLVTAIQEQQKVGNDKIWLGLFVQWWADVQESVYREENEKKELRNKLIKRLI